MRSLRERRLYHIVRQGLLGEALSQVAGALLVFMTGLYGFRMWTHKPVVFGLAAASVVVVLVGLFLLGHPMPKQARTRRAAYDADTGRAVRG